MAKKMIALLYHMGKILMQHDIIHNNCDTQLRSQQINPNEKHPPYAPQYVINNTKHDGCVHFF